MFGCETGYAITQDFIDANLDKATPTTFATVNSTMYGVHTYEPRRHLLGVTTALNLFKEEGEVGVRTVIGVFSQNKLG